MAWTGQDSLGHGVAIATVVHTPEGTVLNVNEIRYITAASSRLALIAHYVGKSDEGMTLVGGQFEPLTNVSIKENFLNPPGGNKLIHPHAALDSCAEFRTYKADSILERQGYVCEANKLWGNSYAWIHSHRLSPVMDVVESTRSRAG
eukprot:16445719-Heterocapsa_arctica.AAC.1